MLRWLKVMKERVPVQQCGSLRSFFWTTVKLYGTEEAEIKVHNAHAAVKAHWGTSVIHYIWLLLGELYFCAF